MKTKEIIDGLTDEIEFMVGMGSTPLLQEAARRELLANQEEIEALKEQISDQERRLDDKVKLTKFLDNGNSQLSTENNGLKARVECIADYIYNMEASRGETILFRAKAMDFIEGKTPAQCLVKVRSEAQILALTNMAETLRAAGAPVQIEIAIQTHNSICNILEAAANKIREAANEATET